VELKQKNEGLQMELDNLKHKSEGLDQEIKYKSDLVNNLSLELARTKNDKKFLTDRLTVINDENSQLRQELKGLVQTKGSLQKSIVKLTQDKNKIEKELGSTETIVQNKIDEIWQIKEGLDDTFKKAAEKSTSKDGIELPPIHVNSNVSKGEFDQGMSDPGFSGKVVSLNEENNFIIVDIGESQGIQLGDNLSVYRDSKYIARLEVIQVRQDISAADIKDQWSKIQVGDIVR
jgi:hypothetical protein